jgi:hypothetical protein
MTPQERGDFVLDRMMRELQLFEKYGITDLGGAEAFFSAANPYRKLALAMAERYESDFKSRGRGRPKEHRDDCELVMMIELLRHRDKLSVPKACKTIAQKGALPGNSASLCERYKSLMKMKERPWQGLLQGLKQIAGTRYVEMLEEIIGEMSKEITGAKIK